MTSKQTKPQHAPIAEMQLRNDELIVGGVPISKLAQQLQTTPFFAYDQAMIKRRIGAVKAMLPEVMKLHYAVKANPMPQLLALMVEQLDGFDVASAGELIVALASGMKAKHIGFAGPAKKDDELTAAINARIMIHVESTGELTRISTLADTLGIQPRVALRVNPDFELKSSGMKMGGGAKPFGIDSEQIPSVLKKLADYDLHFSGFHIFTGSQSLSENALNEAHKATFDLALRLSDAAPNQIEMLNMGGGLGVPYFPGDKPLKLDSLKENLTSCAEKWRQRMGETDLIMELGRYLVAEAGVYVTQVIDRKVSRGQSFVVTDGGLHHHLAASGNFGQLIRKNFPVVKAAQVYAGKRENLSVVGPLCTPLDILADRVDIGEVNVGDLVAVMMSGAYAYSASPQNFLGHPQAKEILL